MPATSTTNDMSVNQNVMQVIKRLSDKTISMKSDQIKLFNRINNEMNTLLAKAQEVIRICLSDRNGKSIVRKKNKTKIKNNKISFFFFSINDNFSYLDFISQAESLQAEYAELKRILEEPMIKDAST